jgi:hypothetical protein
MIAITNQIIDPTIGMTIAGEGLATSIVWS